MILVVGSSNTDMVVRSERFPEPGETLLGGEFHMFQGGKGANQAVAAARLGGKVTFVTKVGEDIFGQQAKDSYHAEGMNTSQMVTDPDHPSGVALISVNPDGENQITVASGANMQLRPDEVSVELIDSANFILTQLETPLSVLAHLHEHGKQKLILNPAPAQVIDQETLQDLFLITPNQTETRLLTGIEVQNVDQAAQAADVFLTAGVQNVIITMGSQGSYFKNREESFFVPAQKVEAVDTTAAGDVYNGALVVALDQAKTWSEAIDFATRASAISVTRMGAQSSVPIASEV